MELIDKQKLIKHIESVIDLYGGDIVLQTIKNKIESGTFDTHPTQEEIAKLKEERDSWRRVSERLEREKIQAEQERDALQERLKRLAKDTEEILNEKHEMRKERDEIREYASQQIEKLNASLVASKKNVYELLEGLKWYADKNHLSKHWSEDGERARVIIAKIEGK